MTKALCAGAVSSNLRSGGLTGILAMNSERILYFGRLGSTSMRTLGSATIYVSTDKPFHVKSENEQWREINCALVPPQVPHQLSVTSQLVSVLVEPERIDVRNFCQRTVQTDLDRMDLIDLRERLRSLADRMTSCLNYQDLLGAPLDDALSGTLPERHHIDARIRRILNCIEKNQIESPSAQQCADLADLSFSRFLHLFKDEIGITFRRFKAWKRARRLLSVVTENTNLTDIALEIGYPDSSHFSNSIRSIYGFRPKDIFIGSRRMSWHVH